MPDFDGDSDLAWLAWAIAQREKTADVERWFVVSTAGPRRRRRPRFN
ncbi:MAG: hypothetical protein KF773_04330 [Deltaproteobacteria bacterium]|nr:hypothetical protein [Deltaproteobacteria bacterium]